jgi:hypothetical protein
MKAPHRTAGNYWAMWWGIALAAIFVVAATISFTMDDRSIQTAAFSYEVR